MQTISFFTMFRQMYIICSIYRTVAATNNRLSNVRLSIRPATVLKSDCPIRKLEDRWHQCDLLELSVLLSRGHLCLAISPLSISMCAMTTIISRCRRAATLMGLIGLTWTGCCLWTALWLRSITNDAKYWWHVLHILSVDTDWIEGQYRSYGIVWNTVADRGIMLLNFKLKAAKRDGNLCALPSVVRSGTFSPSLVWRIGSEVEENGLVQRSLELLGFAQQLSLQYLTICVMYWLDRMWTSHQFWSFFSKFSSASSDSGLT